MTNKANYFLGLVSAIALLGCDNQQLDDGEDGIGNATLIEQSEPKCPPNSYLCNAVMKAAKKVDYGKVLVITSTDVVDNCRTKFTPTPGCNIHGPGPWSFGYLMQRIAGTQDPSAFVLAWLQSLKEPPGVDCKNPFLLTCRPRIQETVIDPWMKASGCQGMPCKLDFDKAPFRLVGFSYRPDLRSDSTKPPGFYGRSSSGQFHITFNFTDANPDPTKREPLQAGLIFEYRLPMFFSAQQWAQTLGELAELKGEAYNQHLNFITDLVTGKWAGIVGFNPSSTLLSVHTGEAEFDDNQKNPQWSFRSFTLQCSQRPSCPQSERLLRPTFVANTPDVRYYANQQMLGPYLKDNADKILHGQHVVPLMLNGQQFLGDEALSHPVMSGQEVLWGQNVDLSPLPPKMQMDVRSAFGFMTCNGCHYAETNNVQNLHLGLREPGKETTLSAFLLEKGQPLTVEDEREKKGIHPLSYNEPLRRKIEYQWALLGRPGPFFAPNGERIH